MNSILFILFLCLPVPNFAKDKGYLETNLCHKKTITITTSPSIALIKYWGKSDSKQNFPATSSIAVTLDNLYTKTSITQSEYDQVFIKRL